eukprot:Skav223558  [mRNA]  locus=scaffold2197:33414:33716:+ [translate_table: standard]
MVRQVAASNCRASHAVSNRAPLILTCHAVSRRSAAACQTGSRRGSNRVAACQTVSRRVKPCRSVSNRVAACQTVSRRVKPCRSVSNRVAACQTVSRRVKL